MSDVSQGPGWWLASDGRWYPPPGQPGVPSPPRALVGTSASLPGTAVPPALAVVLQVAFAFTAAMYLLTMVVTQQARTTFDEWWNAPTPDAELLRAALDADERLSSFAPMTAVTNVALLVLVIVWMRRSHRATDRLRPGPRKWSGGWTIGGWFIPLGNLVIPKRVVNEIERLATAPRIGGVVAPGWQSVRTSAVGWAWWLLFVTGYLGMRSAVSTMNDATEAFDGPAVIEAYELALIASVFLVASAVCGAVFVGRISRRLSPAAFATAHDEDPYRTS